MATENVTKRRSQRLSTTTLSHDYEPKSRVSKDKIKSAHSIKRENAEKKETSSVIREVVEREGKLSIVRKITDRKRVPHYLITRVRKFITPQLGSLFHTTFIIMCQAETYLHRLLNFKFPYFQRIKISPQLFFIILACFFVSVLLGGIFLFDEPEAISPPEVISQDSVEEIRRQFKTDMETLKHVLKDKENNTENDHVKSNTLSDLLAKVDSHNEKISEICLGRITALEDQLKESFIKIGDYPSQPEGMFSQLFNDELRKVIQEKIGDFLSHFVDGANITKQDIQRMIDASLGVYGADRIGSFDFALENAGGSVMLDHCSPTHSYGITTVRLFGFSLWNIPSSPNVIIQPSLYPGDCWAMEGQSGFATIKMSAEVVVTGVSIDHIPKELTPNGILDSAPKDFSVSGLTSLDGPESNLGSFSYDINGPNIQTYSISDGLQRPYSYVKFQFTSNHGNKEYTCVYRVRVHGH